MTNSPLENMAIGAGYDMASIYSVAPKLMEQLARQTPLSYDAFVNQIDKDLNKIISTTESGRQHHYEKGEDSITEHIIVQLKSDYPSVHHDAQQGGHCDIYIEATGSDGSLYKWIMEAKLWGGFGYVYKGLDKQLLGSYAQGGVNNCKGGLIFYSKLSSGAKYAMDEWHAGLKNKGIAINNVSSDGLRLDTSHRLNGGTGADFHVNHYCVDVYHAPTKEKLEKAQAKAIAKIQADAVKAHKAAEAKATKK